MGLGEAGKAYLCGQSAQRDHQRHRWRRRSGRWRGRARDRDGEPRRHRQNLGPQTERAAGGRHRAGRDRDEERRVGRLLWQRVHHLRQVRGVGLRQWRHQAVRSAQHVAEMGDKCEEWRVLSGVRPKGHHNEQAAGDDAGGQAAHV